LWAGARSPARVAAPIRCDAVRAVVDPSAPRPDAAKAGATEVVNNSTNNIHAWRRINKVLLGRFQFKTWFGFLDGSR
jgi:hypothetical protein